MSQPSASSLIKSLQGSCRNKNLKRLSSATKKFQQEEDSQVQLNRLDQNELTFSSEFPTSAQSDFSLGRRLSESGYERRIIVSAQWAVRRNQKGNSSARRRRVGPEPMFYGHLKILLEIVLHVAMRAAKSARLTAESTRHQRAQQQHRREIYIQWVCKRNFSVPTSLRSSLRQL